MTIVSHRSTLPKALHCFAYSERMTTYPLYPAKPAHVRLHALQPSPLTSKGRRPRRLCLASFTALEETVELPLQLHRLLQVSQASSRETCSRVIEKLSSSPPAVGYTQVRATPARSSAIAWRPFLT